MTGAVVGVLVAVLLIAAGGLFVAAEFSLVAVEPTQLEPAAAAGDRRAARVLAAIRSLSLQLSGAQLGITVTSLVIGYIAEPSLARLVRPVLASVGVPGGVAGGISLALALALATVSQMIFGELVPKNWAVSAPAAVARRVVGPHTAFTMVFRPLITALNAVANRIVRAFGVEPTDELRTARSGDELGSIVRSSAERGTLPATTASLLDRTLRFGDRTAEDVMTPRVRVVDLAAGATAADLLRAAESSGHSRFPVHAEGDPDDLVGVVHVKDAFAVPRGDRETTPVTAFAAPPVVVPSSLACDALLATLRHRGLQLAVVIDEFGGTAGVVTLEDLVEELVGRVWDEYDTAERPDSVRRPGGGWLVAGLLRLDEVAEATGIRLPEGPYETVAGLVMARLGRLPAVGDAVTVDRVELAVTALDRHRVDRVAITPLPDDDADADESGGEPR